MDVFPIEIGATAIGDSLLMKALPIDLIDFPLKAYLTALMVGAEN